jgi:hypothetical protein
LLTARELKPHLHHEDWLVREAVADYFRTSWSRDPELVPMILATLQHYGAAACTSELSACTQFVLTSASLGAVLAALSDAQDDVTALHLNRVIATAPGELLAAIESRILETPRLHEATIARVHRRRDLSTWPPGKLWTATRELAHLGGRYVDEVDLAYADDLVDALARHDQPSIPQILAAIADADDHWLEIFAIDLSAARGVREAVPALIGKLRIETDYLCERAARALSRIGDPRAVEQIRSIYRSESWNFRLYASSVLAAIKSEAAEDALLALRRSEQDLSLRTWLCMGLCEQFSARGLDVVLRQIDAGYDESVASLEHMVLPVAAVLGVPLPDGRAWRAAAERERAQLRAGELALAASDLDRNAGIYDPELPWDSSDDLEAFASPHVRARNKVGRNAPCPCGSGRKFKRCCGRTG